MQPYLPLLRELMDSVRLGQREMVLSVVTELELLVRPLRDRDAEGRERVRMLFEDTDDVLVCQVTRPIVHIAAELRAFTRLALADATIIATGIYTDCDAVVGNDERCAQRVREIPYLYLDALVKERQT